MPTDEDKYLHIQAYLNGTLNESEVAAFEAELSMDMSLREEVMLHRMANELILDSYLLEVKESTQKIIANKRNWNRSLKWGTGLGLLALVGGISYVLLPQATKQRPTRQETPTHAIILPSPETKITVEKTSLVPKNPAVSLTIHDTIKEKSEAQEGSAPVTEVLPMEEKVQTTTPIEIQTTSLAPTPIQIQTKPIMRVDSIKESPKTETTEEPLSPQTSFLTFDLLFNPLLGEEASFPFDDSFNGEIIIFDANGTVVHRSRIQNGHPNRWDGRSTIGGVANSGQYGVLIKDRMGKELQHGYITIAK